MKEPLDAEQYRVYVQDAVSSGTWNKDATTAGV